MSFNLDDFIDAIPDFPKPGILFRDISPVLENPAALRQVIDALHGCAQPLRPELIAGVDARGFLFAAPLALRLDIGTVMLRKPGKLPGETLDEVYSLEYGDASLSLQTRRQVEGRRVLLCDDLIATGGTLAASARLIERAGGAVVGAVCLIELTALAGREQLSFPFAALHQYGE
ncbi:MAG: adenine phosphoribosyltransferase [Gammaproteobacteria bacterium AqS3]|nr:adenine phosphoribosyltransferase [Gammaproteobacteria bacterium AqS3]